MSLDVRIAPAGPPFGARTFRGRPGRAVRTRRRCFADGPAERLSVGFEDDGSPARSSELSTRSRAHSVGIGPAFGFRNGRGRGPRSEGNSRAHARSAVCIARGVGPPIGPLESEGLVDDVDERSRGASPGRRCEANAHFGLSPPHSAVVRGAPRWTKRPESDGKPWRRAPQMCAASRRRAAQSRSPRILCIGGSTTGYRVGSPETITLLGARETKVEDFHFARARERKYCPASNLDASTRRIVRHGEHIEHAQSR